MHNILYTKDIKKQRKKWQDGLCRIDDNILRITEHLDGDENRAESILFSGKVEPKILSQLLRMEETQLGLGLIVQLGDRLDQAVLTESKKNTERIEIVPFQYPNGNAATKPFNCSSTHMVSHSAPSMPIKSELYKPFKAPSTTGNVIGTTTAANKSSPGIPTIMATVAQLTLPTTYGKLQRRQQRVPAVFSTITTYCRAFECAYREELQLSLGQAMEATEQKTCAVLGLTKGTDSRSNNANKRNHLQSPPTKTSESIVERLRAVGLPYMAPVSVVINYPRSTGDADNSGSDCRKRSREDDFSMQPKAETNDEINKHSQSIPASAQNSTSNTKKLYLKFDAAAREAPRAGGCEPFGVGDLWAVWIEGNSSLVSGIALKDSISTEQMRAYRTARAAGYPFPWYQGRCVGSCHILRSLWHSVGATGLLEVCFADGSVQLPSGWMLPVGQECGAIEGRFLAFRLVPNLSTDLHAWDVLRVGTLPTEQQEVISQLAPAASITTPPSLLLQIRAWQRLRALTQCSTFARILQPPNCFAPTAALATDAPSVLIPVLPAKTISELVLVVQQAFALNVEQADVLSRVGSWFVGSVLPPVPPVLLVKGVFGAGKSLLLAAVCTLIAAVSRESQCASQTDMRRLRCLLASNTNVAVDRVLTLLVAKCEYMKADSQGAALVDAVRIARVGSLPRVDRRLRELLVFSHENVSMVQREIQSLLSLNGVAPCEAHVLQELLALTQQKEFGEKQQRKLYDADVVGVTCASSVSSSHLDCTGPNFDVLLLDEASQMTECASLLPLCAARPKFILICGDPAQLPPTLSGADAVINESSKPPSTNSECSGPLALARSGSMSTTLYDRLKTIGWPETRLRVQYRCHPQIAACCSNLFYHGQLHSGVTAGQRPALLRGLPPLSAIGPDNGASFGVEQSRGGSYTNNAESAIVESLVCWFAKNALRSGISVGVVCFFKAQVAELRCRLADDSVSGMAARAAEIRLFIGTVDSVQGSEFDIVVLCTTRAHYVASAFLNHPARVNVSLSRARHHAVLLGNLWALRDHPSYWQQVLRAVEAEAPYVAALQEICAARALGDTSADINV